MKNLLSYQHLEKFLGFTKPLIVTEKWSAAPDFLKIISDYCLENKPETIVECSSGTSSLVISQCCKKNNFGHVYSLENGKEFAELTRRHLSDHRLNEYNDVLDAPLVECTLNGNSYQWYDINYLPAIKIDMLVIDGPPGFIQKNSRYPALPRLHDQMNQHCLVLLDDAAREDEQETVRLWLQEYPEFQAEYIDNERGCSILSR
jgi:hypothetical protein